jgi:hypothetical protein
MTPEQHAQHKTLIQTIRDGVSKYFAERYGKEVQGTDDHAGLLFFTIRENGMTDSFKLVISYTGGSYPYTIEITDREDVGSKDFQFKHHEAAIDCYMAIATFYTERVKSRLSDI